jgi:radical SAM protein with 4Fe4S-binding SPASM domain
MCPRSYQMTRPQGFMDIGLFQKIIDDYTTSSSLASQEELWLHHFGESLLHPQFDEAISYASSRGLKPSLSLNPLALTQERAVRILKARPYLLYLSFDGFDEESFSYLRGVKGQFENSKENALNFLQLKISMNSDVIVTISAINIPGRKKIIDEIRSFWEHQAGVNLFLCKEFVDFNGAIENISNMMKEEPFEFCNKPHEYLTITWDGTVVPCCYDFDQLYPLGNINNESLTEIWNGSKMRSLRQEFDEKKITNKLCATCITGGKFIKRLKFFLKEKRPLYLWGAAKNGIKLLRLLNTMHQPIRGFIDSDTSKHGNYLEEIKIYSPQEIFQTTENERPFIIITSKAAPEIKEQLQKNKFKQNEDFIAYNVY